MLIYITCKNCGTDLQQVIADDFDETEVEVSEHGYGTHWVSDCPYCDELQDGDYPEPVEGETRRFTGETCVQCRSRVIRIARPNGIFFACTCHEVEQGKPMYEPLEDIPF